MNNNQRDELAAKEIIANEINYCREVEDPKSRTNRPNQTKENKENQSNRRISIERSDQRE